MLLGTKKPHLNKGKIIKKEMTHLLKIFLGYKTASDVLKSNLNNSGFLLCKSQETELTQDDYC